jgi:hypothetical protein
MLEITGDDIAALNDEDLRRLVGMLSEVELRSRGLSTSAATWGGNQNAADGGIDVRVKIDNDNAIDGFIPRASTGFQVKKTDFTPGSIDPEMRPSGQLRASICGLIDECGAYIIASSGSNASDTALTARVDAMRAAVADHPQHANLYIDFYDRNRLATWARSHPGLVLWVRQKVGRSIPGWQPYGSWAVSPDGVDDEYLIDDKVRLHAGTTDGTGIDAKRGIHRIRDILREPRGVVRLAGLSGVGKTRLVQALFDGRVGNDPLDHAMVIYTDMKDNPAPQPTGMISDLIASRERTIVVVDNCASDLHRRISELCQTTESAVSAITVEYDVREDEPEGTKAFRLEPSSAELVAKLLARRFPDMSRPNVEKIADFSGGNARIAMALANTLENHESIAGLRDEELFSRLFHQRQQHDDSLLRAAMACSLVYSFQGESLSGNDAELPRLAELAGTSAQQLYAKVAQLKDRDLVQCRSVWRAILPHAVANRLAAMALRETPFAVIQRHFDTDRLLQSFSRRLGYLHECEEARRIAENWLAAGGPLAELSNLNQLGLAIFNNIAAVSPEATLCAIERAMAEPGSSESFREQLWSRICLVLQSIAYDSALFDRCVAVMIPIALAEQGRQSHPNTNLLEGLFHVVLSGTHATVEQRIAKVNDLLCSNEPGRQSLGVRLLRALLQSNHISATQSFEFGARVRDYGYRPTSLEDKSHWYAAAVRLASRFASVDDDRARAIRSTLAQAFLSLWAIGPEVQEQYEAIASEIAENGYWQEGWIAARSVLASMRDQNDVAARDRLRAFERRLFPKTVAEKVRAVVLSPRWGSVDYAEMDIFTDATEPNGLETSHQKAWAAAEELGKEVGTNLPLFQSLLLDLVRGDGGRLFPFGKGLSLSAHDHRGLWSQLTQAFADTEEGKRKADTLTGFVNGLAIVDQALCEILLEEAVEHETLGILFPALQGAVPISLAGVERLKRAIVKGRARAGAFDFLGFRRDVSAENLRDIVRLLAKQHDGFGDAVAILAMLLTEEKQEKEHPCALVEVGRELLSSPQFGSRDNMFDYHLHVVAKVSLRGVGGAATARKLCEQLMQAFRDRAVSTLDHGYLLTAICESQPRIPLDIFFGHDDCSDADFDELVDAFEHRKNPLDGLPTETVLEWCDERPHDRYVAIAHAVPFHTVSKEGEVGWTPVAMEMLKRAPDAVSVLKIFIARFCPRTWSGSLAAAFESRIVLLDQLRSLSIPSLEGYAAEVRPQVEGVAARMRKSEDEQDKASDERFE